MVFVRFCNDFILFSLIQFSCNFENNVLSLIKKLSKIFLNMVKKEIAFDKNIKYIASCSGGKDSVATVILAHEYNEPLDEIIFVEVMFDDKTSGEFPEHIDFIKNKLKPTFESWGYKFTILHSDENYLDSFFHKVTRSKKVERNGKSQGFPLGRGCNINSNCKRKPFKRFFKENKNAIFYTGIAIDEPVRLERLKKHKEKISLLEKYNFTEKDAYELCKKYNLLSPSYNFSKRGGCWFCPNASDKQLRHLRTNHKDLWEKLLSLENEDVINKYWKCWNKTLISDKEKKFSSESQNI